MLFGLTREKPRTTDVARRFREPTAWSVCSMTSPLEHFAREELITYARALIGAADARLETDNVEAACWRLADALGALSILVGDTKVMGINSYTGLGYKLDRTTDDNPVEVVKVESSG
jgi:hypothetical protein